MSGMVCQILLVGHECSELAWLVGNSGYAAITAVFAANVVLFAYIIVSLLEDRESLQSGEEKKLQFSNRRKDE
jgi:hypothetical protein